MRSREDILYAVCQPRVLRISNEFLVRKSYFSYMELSTTHLFVQKLPFISKQCNEYRETTVPITKRTVGNVVQSIPLVDANRDNDARSYPGTAVRASGLRIPIAPTLNRKISSPLVPAWRIFFEIRRKNRKTEEHKTYGQTVNETDIRLDGKETAFPSPSRVKLLSLLGMVPPFVAAGSSAVSQTPRKQRLVRW